MFEVPLRRRPGHSDGQPLKAMGRFMHEALATDDRSGIVYETEDPGSGRGAGFYRFLPRDRHNLRKGGRLQILGIKGSPYYDAREGQKRGRPLPVKWIDIDDPDPEYTSEDDPNGHLPAGLGPGACLFNRLEGCWADGDSIYFVSTSGGDVKNGDVNPPTVSCPATTRATGRSGSTASARARSSCTTSRRAGRSWTRPTTSPSRRAAA